MVINYKKTQKTILRVNPRIPLAELLPAICEKCEFDTDTTVLLKDVASLAPLDLSNSLNDYAIREVYAKDTQGNGSKFTGHVRVCVLADWLICELSLYKPLGLFALQVNLLPLFAQPHQVKQVFQYQFLDCKI